MKLRRKIKTRDFGYPIQTLEIFDKWDENNRWLGVADNGELWIVWNIPYTGGYRYSYLNLMRNYER